MTEVPARRRYPAVPTDIVQASSLGSLNRILAALRERVEIYARDRGRVEDSMVTVQDLLDLGVISAAQADTLRRRT